MLLTKIQIKKAGFILIGLMTLLIAAALSGLLPYTSDDHRQEAFIRNLLPTFTDQLNEKAPYMIDPTLRFDEAVADIAALNITYLNTFVSLSSDDSDFKFVDEHLPDAIDYLCNDQDIRMLIDYGVSYTYIYRDRHGVPVRKFIYSENTCSQL
jgi:hypothetical protein